MLFNVHTIYFPKCVGDHTLYWRSKHIFYVLLITICESREIDEKLSCYQFCHIFQYLYNKTNAYCFGEFILMFLVLTYTLYCTIARSNTVIQLGPRCVHKVVITIIILCCVTNCGVPFIRSMTIVGWCYTFFYFILFYFLYLPISIIIILQSRHFLLILKTHQLKDI